MPEYTAARLIENKVSQDLVLGDPTGLLLQSVTRWRWHAPANDITRLAFRMAADNFDSNAWLHQQRP